MVFNLFRKSKTDDFIKPPITVKPSSEEMVFETSGPAKMTVEDVFLIKGRGTVITGQIESGTFHVGQKITIETENGPIETTITGVETFRNHVDFASAGTNAGLVLDNVDHKAIKHGNIVNAIVES